MVCLDTTFVIDFLRGAKDIQAIKENLDKTNESITITAPTVIEITRGLYLNNVRPDERQKVEDMFSSLIILDLDNKSAMLAGKIEAELIRAGKQIDLEDIMIASIAITNNQKLITRNTRHFKRIKGLQIESY
jgi:tRNA(fMet)-specific endonuclease VapC